MSLSQSNPNESESKKSWPQSRPESDLAWAAGFADGEACIHIAKQRYRIERSDTYRLGVHVTQNDLAVLEHFRDIVGIHAPIYGTKRQQNHRRQCYTLNYSGKCALKLISLLLTYLRRKQREAQAAIAFWREGRIGERRGGRGLASELVATREHYFLLLKQLK